jgi:hypothetical protein
MLRVVTRWIVGLRAQRWSREILLAIGLTLAAAVFIAAALMGQKAAHVQEAPPFAAADK